MMITISKNKKIAFKVGRRQNAKYEKAIDLQMGFPE